MLEPALQIRGLLHECKTPTVRTINAHIESFHAILENECYRQNEFQTFLDACKYMNYCNERRRHGSLNYQSPRYFHQAFMSNSLRRTAIVA
ncbi:MAG: integrase core domain-containing protein [Limnochordia bacterium]